MKTSGYSGLCILLPIAFGFVLGCGTTATEAVGDVSGDYVLAAQFTGSASDCTLTGAQLRLVAAADGTLSGSLDGGEFLCQRSDPTLTPTIVRPASVQGGDQDGQLLFSLVSPIEGTSFCTLFVFTVSTGRPRLSGRLHTVQVFCQGFPKEQVTGTWSAEPDPGAGGA